MKRIIFLVFAMISLNTYSQPKSVLDSLCNSKSYSLLEHNNNDRSALKYFYFKSIYAKVCNKNDLSNIYLDSLFLSQKLNDTLLLKSLQLRLDNYFKLFDYKNAYRTSNKINSQYRDKLSKEDLKHIRFKKIVSKTLQETKPQIVRFNSPDTIPLNIDRANLINIDVNCHNIDTNFVLDSGASFSCITRSLAKNLNLKILNSERIIVKGSNGHSRKVELGLADSIRISGVTIYHPYFLIFKDKDLSFYNGAYKINGIIGFPIIKEFRTLFLEKDRLIISKTCTEQSDKYSRNLFVERMIPLITLNYQDKDLIFALDTGAKTSTLNKCFYEQFRTNLKLDKSELIVRKYFGVDGVKKHKLYELEKLDLKLCNQNISLKNPSLFTEKDHVIGASIYGNIGQDLLRQYKRVVISYEHNYFKLDTPCDN